MDSPWRAGRLMVGHRAQVIFGRMYEDHNVELDLFPPGSRVLAIASAGDVAAALARSGHRVTAVDINPAQLAYAQARLAGAPAVMGSAERILAAGRIIAGALVSSWRPAALTRFLRLDDPAAQLDWWRQELDRPPLRALMRVTLGHAGALAAVLRHGLRDVLVPRFDLILRRRIAAGIARYPNVDNPWAWQLLLGRERPGPARPATVSDVEWVRADVVEHLWGVPAGSYDAATLSNVVDGPPPTFARALHDALRHGVRPGGTVVLRTFADRSPLPGRPLDDRSLLWGAVTQVQIGQRSCD